MIVLRAVAFTLLLGALVLDALAHFDAGPPPLLVETAAPVHRTAAPDTCIIVIDRRPLPQELPPPQFSRGRPDQS